MNPVGLFGLFSGWRIVAPSNPLDYIGLFNMAVSTEDPVLVIEHGKLYGEVGPVPENNLDYCVEYGKARVIRPGKDVTVLTYLTGVKNCLVAAEAVARKGVQAEVVDLRTLDYVGIEYAAIGASTERTGSVLIVEEILRSQGLAARLADEIQERFYDSLDCPIGKVTAADVPREHYVFLTSCRAFSLVTWFENT